MADTILQAESLVKEYRMGASRLRVLHGVDLTVGPGEFLCILGPSGSGKSTLLHLMGLLDRPTAGRVILDGQDAFAQPKRWRDRMRNSFLGFVFQFYYLMPDLSVLANTLLPAMIRTPLLTWPAVRGVSRRRAMKVLADLGLSERVAHLPRELSGGERQRAALARALVHEPRILFADEPTGNLDSATGEEIMRVITRLNRRDGLTVIMVTHDGRVAEQADRVLRLRDGKLLHAP
jgi:ABC-type lipoprotein export system ATPase subunit